MGFSSKIISGLRSMSMSAKQTPPTPSDSIPPTPKIPQDTIEFTAVSIEPLPAGSKRWSRNFTSSTKPIPRPMIAPISRSYPSPAKPTVAVSPPLTADLANLVKVFQFVDEKFSNHFKTANLEPEDQEIKDERDIVTLRKTYQWQQGASTNPPYPPCLLSIPEDEQVGLLEIFNLKRLIDTTISILPTILVPESLSEYAFGDTGGKTMASLEADLRRLTRKHKNIGEMASIANRSDWYTDAVFGQQSFTGPNPMSIEQASLRWITEFADAAKKQGNDAVHTLIANSGPDSFYVQDYSYFREAAGAMAGQKLQSDDKKRFGCAAVTLLQLSPTGNLHPLAICIDYVQSLDHSVVIFNFRLSGTDPTTGETEDWPWRYAKTCHMISDYYRHELGAHLNNCHFVEEAIIVAASRSFTADHIVYQILEPHWLKTLSLNASARETLVPKIVTNIVGLSNAQTYNFILSAYKSFNFKESYIPSDLLSRGFSTDTINSPKMHNYTWAKNMLPMWSVLQKFVLSVLSPYYKTDAEVMNDQSIRSWCTEMHSPTGAQIPSFPEINTIAELVDAVVMCIHIASPQHNTVNYLQCYYMSFVAAKPPCFVKPLPNSLDELKTYTEETFMAALPVKNEHVWLMAEQLPYLLSYGVAEDQTLVSYAETLQDEALKGGDNGLAKAAKGLYDDLMGLGILFEGHSSELDEGIVRYTVMDPTKLAVSVLI